jgi:signal transduction histidine kinase
MDAVGNREEQPALDKLRSRIAELEEELKASNAKRGAIGAGSDPIHDRELETLLQRFTDQGTRLIGAEFGAFFYNETNHHGQSYLLHTLSGASKEAFAGFPIPRNTEVFAPSFRGEAAVLSGDITKDPRYGKNAPYQGMPPGHLPVKSFLSVPVTSRSGEVLGGLFFGHSGADQFTGKHENQMTEVAAQAARAIDNVKLFEQARWVQEELKRSNEELRRANRDLETFAYSASHDLQEPLRNIAINAQLLERAIGNSLDSDSARFLQSVLQGAHRMETLVQDLSAYTHAIKHADGTPPAISAGAILNEVLVTLRVRVEEAGAAITVTDLPVISMHEIHLSQLFQNLIGNALKYRREEEKLLVHISATAQDGWWVLSVADNGIGIDMKYADQIFGLFKRLHTHREYPGSGVGLAICRRIVEQYGGRIWLEKATPGSGSTFCFAVPESASEVASR